jgi:iron complex transport system ATP-binding protein
MEYTGNEILLLDSLEIGYTSGRTKKILLPPVNATALEGELIAVIGKNGIGKSTLLKTITGLLPLVAGNIAINGKNIKEYSRIELSGMVGYISTEIVKVSNMTVYDLVALGRYPHTNWFGRIDARNHLAVNDALSRAGMIEFSGRQLTELSDGERQRAMIALVLAQDTKLIVMDEPTAFLDIKSKYEIIHLLKELTRQKQKTIVYSTHDFSTAISQADKIWLMLENDLIEGAPEDIMLRGSFNSLFNTSVVKFNKDDGTFSISTEGKGRISVSGKGKNDYWTRKAITRAGYTINDSDSDSVPLIESPSSESECWKFTGRGISAGFDTIYDLIGWMRKNEDLIS